MNAQVKTTHESAAMEVWEREADLIVSACVVRVNKSFGYAKPNPAPAHHARAAIAKARA